MEFFRKFGLFVCLLSGKLVNPNADKETGIPNEPYNDKTPEFTHHDNMLV